MYGDSVITLAPSLYIIEILGLSFLTSIYFVWSMLVFLSDKLADEIDLDLFIVFTVFSVSVLLEALDLSNDLDLSNYILLSDSLLMDLYISIFKCL